MRLLEIIKIMKHLTFTI